MLKKSLVMLIAVFMFLGAASLVSACTDVNKCDKDHVGHTRPSALQCDKGYEGSYIDTCTKIETKETFSFDHKPKPKDTYEWVTSNSCTLIPVDGYWSDWTPVNDQCGIKYDQTRTCTEPIGTGKPCSEIDGGNSTQTITNKDCPLEPVDGYWSDWSPKSEECGYTGEQTRTCTPPQNGGKECEEGPSTQSYTNDACVEPTPEPTPKKHHSSGGSVPFLVQQTQCGPYLTQYISRGAENDATEVTKLQTFLNEYLGLTLKVDGKYGEESFEAVKVFQVKSAPEVLVPWVGIGSLKPDTKGTGFVYKTTQRWINMIKCPSLNLPMPVLD